MQNNVYENVSIINVINKLNLKKTYIKGDTMYVVCPFCQKGEERKGNMKINTTRNVYRCDVCELSGSSIELYAKKKYVTTKEAFSMLLKENPVLDNIPYNYNNPVKDETYRDIVYRRFLELQVLNKEHHTKLKNMNFTDEYINKYLFKSIEIDNSKKKKICLKLQEEGFKLDGISGFYQDTDFKWTYKAHSGIFIPVILDNKIQGLRIMLDEEYNKDTENIWFSSNNEYNGTKAYNWPMVLKNENDSWFDMYNSKKKTNIIIGTEMILAHKLFNNTGKIVIGVPNNIDKEIISNIVNRLNASHVTLYVDKYTILHTSTLMYVNIIDTLEEQNVKVDFRIAINDNNIGEEIERETRKIA
ncbi:MAG: hypothetical protein J6M60_00340 [Clostridia bacterium]|nr:hypothetical protein [Clostridia bacterium]